ncbi:MAG: alpha/beta fold hydrolase, partial [Planctomycetota bacterium]
MPSEPAVDLAAALAALDAVLAREPVDPRRIYLTGLSMGGYGSWELAARHPDRFAAVLPIC